jgi:hypothetical protein
MSYTTKLLLPPMYLPASSGLWPNGASNIFSMSNFTLDTLCIIKHIHVCNVTNVLSHFTLAIDDDSNGAQEGDELFCNQEVRENNTFDWYGDLLMNTSVLLGVWAVCAEGDSNLTIMLEGEQGMMF